MQNDERAMLRDSLRRLLVETDSVKVAAALDEFGWVDLLAAEPGEAVAALFETQGETLSVSPALNAVMARPLLSAAGRESGDVGEWTVAIPGPGSGVALSPAVYAIPDAASLGRCLVVTNHDDPPALTVVEPLEGAATVNVRPVGGVDPWLGLVRFDPATTKARAERVARGVPVALAWEQSVATGRRALSHELIGLSRAMLAMAVKHARERRQFGQPIGAFQAVKHRLAEAKVSLTAAEAAAEEAWAAPGPLTALLAKLWAGRAARLVAKQAQQVLGGMGFTWEHSFHRHVRRALLLDSLLGSTTALQHELGRSLLAGGHVPRLAAL
jgi:Acyl-CoA dehydrogenase, C-terminal domain